MKFPDKLPTISKNVFFGFGFVLFTCMIMLVNWLFSLPVTRTDTLLKHLSETTQKIHQLRALQSEILLNLEQEKDIFSGTDKNQEVKDAFGSIRQDIDFYRGFALVVKHENVAASFDELAASIDQYRNNLNELILASVERGSLNSGLINRWRTLSGAMLTMSAREKPEVVRSLENIRLLENQYLIRGEQQTLDAIIDQANAFRASLSGKEDGIPAADVESYLNLTTSLKSVDARLGISSSEGLIRSIPVNLNRVIHGEEQINGQLKELIRQTRIRWTIIRFLVIALFTIAGILAVVLVTRLAISKPLTRAADDMDQLTSGEFPEVKLIKGSLPEIIQISKSMIQLVERLKSKSAFARALNEDRLEDELPLSGSQDALGKELNNLRRKIKDNAEQQKLNEEENVRRRYINDGLAKFAEILRTGNTDIVTLGDVFIRELVKYLGAIQGGFFLLEEDHAGQTVLNLVSSFAYNRKKYMQKSIALGEGLVGTCALEKQVINMTEIPKGYISITSGLGDTKPDNLLLLPVLHENDLVGVLEVASLHKYLDHQLVFATDVAASLGSTLIYTRNNQKTSELLRKSQQQAQEMAEQEEEMRQNMEELKATQEESARREEELSGLAEAIDRSLFVASYDTEGHLIDINDRLCIFLGCNREDAVGQLHQEVFHGTLKPDAAFWEETAHNGRTLINDKVRIGKKEFKLKFHFTAVFSADGFLLRYISFITDQSA